MQGGNPVSVGAERNMREEKVDDGYLFYVGVSNKCHST